MTDEALNAMVEALRDVADHAGYVPHLHHTAATAITTLRAQLAEARVERDDALRGKECFQRMTRAHWDALCAMRNEINEYIPMPNTDSGPLFSPEDGPIYADIAERVIADLKEGRAYALALEAELKARADRAEAALAAQIEVDAEICDGMQSSTMYYEAHECANAIRNQPHDRTALDRHDAKTREKALREAAQACDWGDIYGDNAVRTILALIEKPNAR